MTEQPAGRAIVTFARGWQTLVAVRSLGRRGVEVITGDQYSMTPGSLSKYCTAKFKYPDPDKDPAGFLDALEAVVREHKPDDDRPYVLLPIHKESYLIAKHRERFEPHISLALPGIDQILQVHNKGTLAAYAQKVGLPMPETWIPGTVEEFHEQLEAMAVPAFLKIRESSSGVGIAKVDTREELEKTFLKFVDQFKLAPGNLPIIQALVPGDDYCVTTLFNRGKLEACMTYRNLRTYPAKTGPGALRETVDAPAMEKVSAEVLGPLEWHGVAELDFRWDGQPDSEPKLIEVNPRFWGGLIQAVESGWDYPWLTYQLAATGRVDLDAERRMDVKTEIPILAFLATLNELSHSEAGHAALKSGWENAKGEFRDGSKRAGLKALLKGLKTGLDPKARLREARRVLSDHKHNVYDILSEEDPGPALGIFFPLAVFLKHGKVNLDLITGEGTPGTDDGDDAQD
jgi:predicted ATP-grasp superfamily ATP-dependent carboligase